MALSKKSSMMVVLVVLTLLLTQPAYSKRRPDRPGRPGRSGGFCKPGCFLRCMPSLFKSAYTGCLAVCLFTKCGAMGKVLSHPSFHCGVSYVRSKCSNTGAGKGNVPEECVSSCVNNCDANFAGDIY